VRESKRARERERRERGSERARYGARCNTAKKPETKRVGDSDRRRDGKKATGATQQEHERAREREIER